MPNPQQLMSRLEAIGESLSQRPTARALIGLGSVGLELDRLDRFSDLDFFVIVTAGSKSDYLEDLSWLENIAPISYAYRNTPDGFKVLYQDGVFCEFAVFEEDDLEQAAYAPGRVVWKASGVDEAIATPTRADHGAQPRSTDWLIGEALTNLYVGLSRDRRGERLAAMRLIQGDVADRMLELAESVQAATGAPRDPFSRERRYELRYPDMARFLPGFLPGYQNNRQSALTLLSFLDEHFDLNEAMKQALLQLCADDGEWLAGQWRR